MLLTRGALRVEVGGSPTRISVLRAGRPVIRDLRAWCRDGVVCDRFVRVTEGVVAREECGPTDVAVAGTTDLLFASGRTGRLEVAITGAEEVAITLWAEGAPLRLGVDWEAVPGEHVAGLGARHTPGVDHAGRGIQLGADRRYTGPDCPPDMLEVGGIPQGDYAPVPFASSSAGWAVEVDGAGNGVRFDLAGRRGVSARASAGPLRVVLDVAPSPAARLRRWLRRTGGLPALLPEWGHGFWKSRDVYEHQEDAEEDVRGCRWHGIPLDAIVLDSPWETQYNTWEPNPHQFPDFAGMVRGLRAQGVRTVVWVTPWVNLDALDGQVPPDPGSRALHRKPAANYADGARHGHFLRAADGAPYVARWWMGTGSPVDFTSPAADAWWRAQARGVLRLGVAGIKADDGEGYYLPDDVRMADGSTGGSAAWSWGTRYRASMQRALDEVHGPGEGMVFGRSGWTGQSATGVLWAGDQISDWWSLRVTVAASLSAASSGISNWSHDVGGYLGHRLVERCPRELLVRWAQLGCFTPLMQAHGRLAQEPWSYDARTLELYRAYVLLHERLVPYVRAAAATAARSGLPIIRPLSLLDPTDPRAWTLADAYGYGPSLWVAPVLEDGARERAVPVPRGRWIAAWSGERLRGPSTVVAPAPLAGIPVLVREGAIVVTYPAGHVATGLGDTPEDERPLEATLWGEPRHGRALARLADGTRIRWTRGRWSMDADREVGYFDVNIT